MTSTKPSYRCLEVREESYGDNNGSSQPADRLVCHAPKRGRHSLARAAGIPRLRIPLRTARADGDVLEGEEYRGIAIVLDGGRTPDGLFDALKAHLSDEEILELTYITCMYDMHATMCRALHLEYDNVPEPVAEIPAPEGSGDILQAVDE